MHFVLYSTSSDPQVAAALPLIAAACQLQLQRDMQAHHETGGTSTVVAEAGHPIDGAHDTAFEATDEIPEAPGAIAYHTTGPDGRPLCKVGCNAIKQNGGALLSGPGSLASAISHECLEAQADPYVEEWDDFDADHEVAHEVADPVEGDIYDVVIDSTAGAVRSLGYDLELDDDAPVTVRISVSNFITARWFSQGDGPYDQLEKLTAPRTMTSGGYMVLRDRKTGATREVFGDEVPLEKRILKSLFGRRASDWAKGEPIPESEPDPTTPEPAEVAPAKIASANAGYIAQHRVRLGGDNYSVGDLIPFDRISETDAAGLLRLRHIKPV